MGQAEGLQHHLQHPGTRHHLQNPWTRHHLGRVTQNHSFGRPGLSNTLKEFKSRENWRQIIKNVQITLWCICFWFLNQLAVLNCLSHKSHAKFFSSLWMSTWIFKVYLLANHFSHRSHWTRVIGPVPLIRPPRVIKHVKGIQNPGKMVVVIFGRRT